MIQLPPSKTTISCKWVYRVKLKAYRTLDKYKACLVTKGFLQIVKVDFFETFSLIIKYTTIKIILTIPFSKSYELRQIDISNDLLNDDLIEDVYMIQPPGLEQGEGLVCKLTKIFYGLKQAPKAWFFKLNTYLLSL